LSDAHGNLADTRSHSVDRRLRLSTAMRSLTTFNIGAASIFSLGVYFLSSKKLTTFLVAALKTQAKTILNYSTKNVL